MECPICYDPVHVEQVGDPCTICNQRICRSCATSMRQNRHTKCPFCRSKWLLNRQESRHRRRVQIITTIVRDGNRSGFGPFAGLVQLLLLTAWYFTQ